MKCQWRELDTYNNQTFWSHRSRLQVSTDVGNHTPKYTFAAHTSDQKADKHTGYMISIYGFDVARAFTIVPGINRVLQTTSVRGIGGRCSSSLLVGMTLLHSAKRKEVDCTMCVPMVGCSVPRDTPCML